ncbi:hypothetical protein EDD86DRAFT_212926 [Gorgonomyces haynaldii]|nr:hypothetical protein EDD86DRAFT_212926 [Gorgonomyces haynaldii]
MLQEPLVDHIYQTGFINKKYSDWTLFVQPFGLEVNVHKIVVSRSPLLQKLLNLEQNTLVVNDPWITPQGFLTVLGYLYTGHYSVQGDPTFLKSVYQSCLLLGLDAFALHVRDIILADISPKTCFEYADFPLSKDQVMDYMIHHLVQDLITQFGPIWGFPASEGYQELVQVFDHLSFETYKQVLESPSFTVPSDMERFQFAKHVCQVRSKNREQENVLLSFSSGKSGITIVRKQVQKQKSERRLWLSGALQN